MSGVKRVIKNELSRAKKSAGVYISLTFSIVIGICDLLFYYSNFKNDKIFHLAILAWIGTDFQLVFNEMLYTLLPILATMAYGISYYEDIKSGYIKNMCLKVSRKDYYIGKAIVTFIVSALVVILPLILNYLVCLMLYPVGIPEKLSFLGISSDPYLLSSVYFSSSVLYVILFILIDGIFAGSASLFCICIADSTESRFMTLAIPYAFCQMTSAGIWGYNSQRYSFMLLINPIQGFPTNGIIVATVFILTFLVAVIWIILKARKKDIYG